MRRPDVADLMLLATVTLWALNFTVTKYVISHGFEPIAYAALRFSGAALLFSGVTWARERSFSLRRRDLWILVLAAAIGIFLNQLSFVYAIKLTTATTVALLFGTLSQGALAIHAVVPKELVDVLQAVVILSVVATAGDFVRRPSR